MRCSFCAVPFIKLYLCCSTTESIDVHDAIGSNIAINHRGTDIMRIMPKRNIEVSCMLRAIVTNTESNCVAGE